MDWWYLHTEHAEPQPFLRCLESLRPPEIGRGRAIPSSSSRIGVDEMNMIGMLIMIISIVVLMLVVLMLVLLTTMIITAVDMSTPGKGSTLPIGTS